MASIGMTSRFRLLGLFLTPVSWKSPATKSKRRLIHKLSHHIVNSLQFKIDETRWMSQQIKMICLGT